MVYGQKLCKNDDAVWHKLTAQQPIMGYPDITKLAEHWNLSLDACLPARPESLARVHVTWWDIGPTNMLELCTQGVQEWPNGWRGEQYEERVARIAGSHRLRFLADEVQYLAKVISDQV